MAHVTGSRGFLLGGAEILRSLKLPTEENRLSDPACKSPEERVERADRIQVCGAEPAGGTEHEARQACGASFIDAVKRSGETALARYEIGPTLENLRR